MAPLNVRQQVIHDLKPILPRKWKLLPHASFPDVISQVTVLLSFKSYERAPEAPRGPRKATFTLTVLEPTTAPGSSDDALDDDIIDLLNAIDKLAATSNVTWTTAERGVAKDRNGFDIELTTYVDSELQPDPAPPIIPD